MNSTDTITLRALQLKQTLTGTQDFQSDLVDTFMNTHPEEMKKELRNICAFIHKDLFSKVESACSNLGLSKRQLVEMALIDIMEKIETIIDRHEVFEAITNEKEA